MRAFNSLRILIPVILLLVELNCVSLRSISDDEGVKDEQSAQQKDPGFEVKAEIGGKSASDSVGSEEGIRRFDAVIEESERDVEQQDQRPSDNVIGKVAAVEEQVADKEVDVKSSDSDASHRSRSVKRKLDEDTGIDVKPEIGKEIGKVSRVSEGEEIKKPIETIQVRQLPELIPVKIDHVSPYEHNFGTEDVARKSLGVVEDDEEKIDDNEQEGEVRIERSSEKKDEIRDEGTGSIVDKWRQQAIALQGQLKNRTFLQYLKEQASEVLPDIPKFTENQLLDALKTISSRKPTGSGESYIKNLNTSMLNDKQLEILKCAEGLVAEKQRQSFSENIFDCVRGLNILNCMRIFIWPIIAENVPERITQSFPTLPIEVSLSDFIPSRQGEQPKTIRGVHQQRLLMPETVVANILKDALATGPQDENIPTQIDPENFSKLLTPGQLDILKMAEKFLPESVRQEYSSKMHSCVRRFEYFSCVKYFTWPMVKQYYPALPEFPDYQTWYPSTISVYPGYPIVPFPDLSDNNGQLPEVIEADGFVHRTPRPETIIFQLLRSTVEEQPRHQAAAAIFALSDTSSMTPEQLASIQMAQQLVPVAYRAEFVDKTTKCIQEYNYLFCTKYSTWPTLKRFQPRLPAFSDLESVFGNFFSNLPTTFSSFFSGGNKKNYTEFFSQLPWAGSWGGGSGGGGSGSGSHGSGGSSSGATGGSSGAGGGSGFPPFPGVGGSSGGGQIPSFPGGGGQIPTFPGVGGAGGGGQIPNFPGVGGSGGGVQVPSFPGVGGSGGGGQVPNIPNVGGSGGGGQIPNIPGVGGSGGGGQVPNIPGVGGSGGGGQIPNIPGVGGSGGGGQVPNIPGVGGSGGGGQIPNFPGVGGSGGGGQIPNFPGVGGSGGGGQIPNFPGVGGSGGGGQIPNFPGVGGSGGGGQIPNFPGVGGQIPSFPGVGGSGGGGQIPNFPGVGGSGGGGQIPNIPGVGGSGANIPTIPGVGAGGGGGGSNIPNPSGGSFSWPGIPGIKPPGTITWGGGQGSSSSGTGSSSGSSGSGSGQSGGGSTSIPIIGSIPWGGGQGSSSSGSGSSSGSSGSGSGQSGGGGTSIPGIGSIPWGGGQGSSSSGSGSSSGSSGSGSGQSGGGGTSIPGVGSIPWGSGQGSSSSGGGSSSESSGSGSGQSGGGGTSIPGVGSIPWGSGQGSSSSGGGSSSGSSGSGSGQSGGGGTSIPGVGSIPWGGGQGSSSSGSGSSSGSSGSGSGQSGGGGTAIPGIGSIPWGGGQGSSSPGSGNSGQSGGGSSSIPSGGIPSWGGNNGGSYLPNVPSLGGGIPSSVPNFPALGETSSGNGGSYGGSSESSQNIESSGSSENSAPVNSEGSSSAAPENINTGSGSGGTYLPKPYKLSPPQRDAGSSEALLKGPAETLQQISMELKVIDILYKLRHTISENSLTPISMDDTRTVLRQLNEDQTMILSLAKSIIPHPVRPDFASRTIGCLQGGSTFIGCTKNVIWPFVKFYIPNLPAFPEEKAAMMPIMMEKHSSESDFIPGRHYSLEPVSFTPFIGQPQLPQFFRQPIQILGRSPLRSDISAKADDQPIISVTDPKFVPIYTDHPDTVVLKILSAMAESVDQSNPPDYRSRVPAFITFYSTVNTTLNDDQERILKTTEYLIPESSRQVFFNEILVCLIDNAFQTCARDNIWPALAKHYPRIPSFPNFPDNSVQDRPSPSEDYRRISETDVKTGQHGDAVVTITDTRFVPIFSEHPEEIIMKMLKGIQPSSLNQINTPPSSIAKSPSYLSTFTKPQGDILVVAENLLPESIRDIFVMRMSECVRDNSFLDCTRDIAWPTIGQFFPRLPSFPNLETLPSIAEGKPQQPTLLPPVFDSTAPIAEFPRISHPEHNYIQQLPETLESKLEGMLATVSGQHLKGNSQSGVSYLNTEDPLTAALITDKQAKVIRMSEGLIPEDARPMFIVKMMGCVRGSGFPICSQAVAWPTLRQYVPNVPEFPDISNFLPELPEVPDFSTLQEQLPELPNFSQFGQGLGQGLGQFIPQFQQPLKSAHEFPGSQHGVLLPGYTASVGSAPVVPAFPGQPTDILVDISQDRVILPESASETLKRKRREVINLLEDELTSRTNEAPRLNITESDLLLLLANATKSKAEGSSEAPEESFVESLNSTIKDSLTSQQLAILKMVEKIGNQNTRGVMGQVIRCVTGLSFIRCLGIFMLPVITSAVPSLLGIQLPFGRSVQDNVAELFGVSTEELEKELFVRKEEMEHTLLDWYKSLTEDKFKSTFGFIKFEGYGDGEIGIKFTEAREGRAKFKDHKNLPSILTIISDIMEDVLDTGKNHHKSKKDKRKGKGLILPLNEDPERYKNDDNIINMFLQKLKVNATDEDLTTGNRRFTPEDGYRAFEVLFGHRLKARLVNKLEQLYENDIEPNYDDYGHQGQQVGSSESSERVKVIPLEMQEQKTNLFDNIQNEQESSDKFTDEEKVKSALIIHLPKLDEQMMSRKMTDSLTNLARHMNKDKMVQMIPGVGFAITFILQMALAHARAAASMATMLSNMAMGTAVFSLVRQAIFGQTTHPKIKYVYDTDVHGPGISWSHA